MSFFETYNDVPGDTDTYGYLESSGIVYGGLGSGNDSDWYWSELQGGVRYTVSLNPKSTGMLGNLVLRDAAGSVLQTVALISAAGKSISFTPSTGGTYYWSVDGTGTTGNYSLTVTSSGVDDFPALQSTSSLLTAGSTRTGSIEVWSDSDWHKVFLTANHTYVFSNTGGTLSDPYFTLFRSDNGPALAYSSDGEMEYTPAESGFYYVDISSVSGRGTGTYKLVVNDVPRIWVQSGYGEIVNNSDGSFSMVFTLQLSSASTQDVTVKVDTRDETALAGSDYRELHQTITFNAGQTTSTVTVQLLSDVNSLPARAFELNLSEAINAAIAVNYFDPSGTGQYSPQADAWGVILEADHDSFPSLPGDSYFPFQWYLFTTKTVTAWDYATGKGITVAVFDQGIDSGNPDLTSNAAVSLGRIALTLGAGGTPVAADDNHGTMVAGVIAAARDGQGVVGVAYDAQLVPIYTSSSVSEQYVTEITNAFNYAKNFDILNDSWGYGNLLFSDTDWAFLDNASDPLFAPAFDALRDLAATGRNGLGTIVVQSAGNSFSVGDDTNLHNFQNSRYIITVGATDYYGAPTSFSTTGASILVSAPGGAGESNYGSILTTDRGDSAGENAGNLALTDGTSFSAPLVSGIVALMLEVNPGLGYRDVQEILAYSAHQVGVTLPKWSENGAHNWNGGGLLYNDILQDTGFGEVDALAAVRLAATWDTPARTVQNLSETTASKSVGQAIPDDNPTGIQSTIHIDASIVVERVDVTVNITHTFIGDLEVGLIAPSGTTSYLMYRPSQGSLSAFGSSQNDVHFTFDTVLDWGESATGDWKLFVRDLESSDTGTLDSWSIDITGHESGDDLTFIYSDAFSDLLTVDPSRGVLNAPDGEHTINASMMSSDSRIDLSGTGRSTLGGGDLEIAGGTFIRTAYGGAGNDTLIANAAGSTLYGQEGDDHISGGAGSDRIDGGSGSDTAVYTGNRSTYTVMRTLDGYSVSAKSAVVDSDTLAGIETLQFADSSLQVEYNDVVQALYVAYFGRAADPGGMANFSGKLLGMSAPHDLAGLTSLYATDSTLKSLIDAFGTSRESQSLYGSGNTQAFVTAIFTNVLNRAPNPTGLAFWSDAIDHGTLSKGNAALTIMAGALSNTTAQGLLDAALVTTKLAAASSFTLALDTTAETLSYSGAAAAASVRSMLSTVTASTDLNAFEGTIESTVASLLAVVASGSPLQTDIPHVVEVVGVPALHYDVQGVA